MIGARATVRMDRANVRRAVDAGNITSLRGAGAYIRGIAQKSIHTVRRTKYKVIKVTTMVPGRDGMVRRKIVKKKVPVNRAQSAPGSPPHTRRGLLRRAILFEATKESVVIGPSANFVDDVGRVHEFGGRRSRFRQAYPARPFMGPALDRSMPRLAQFWANSVRS